MKRLRTLIHRYHLEKESGIGLPIILLLTALLIGSISLITVAINSVQESTNETARQQGLNIAESGTDYILTGAEDGSWVLQTDQGIFNYHEADSNGVVFPLEAGQTLELNPSQLAACTGTESCVIQIWWNSLEDNPTTPSDWNAQCRQEAALLVSEYSQDACDSPDPASCSASGDTDARTGLARERARYYLFRPASCALGEAGRDWSGYETAFGACGNPDEAQAFHPTSTTPNVCASRQMLGLEGGNSAYQGTDFCEINGSSRGSSKEICESGGKTCELCPNSGSIGLQTKRRLEFRSNNNLSANMSNYYEIPVFPNTTIVRIKALYANTQILVDLPGQVRRGSSIVSDGSGNTQTMVITHSIPAIPSVMDFALFVGQGGIDKNPESSRN
ncbi:hypothetical protein FWH30_01940 [Microgenomates group bacterium]|nr:hypothetical protein [Microgenomates group bacterium]